MSSLTVVCDIVALSYMFDDLASLRIVESIVINHSPIIFRIHKNSHLQYFLDNNIIATKSFYVDAVQIYNIENYNHYRINVYCNGDVYRESLTDRSKWIPSYIALEDFLLNHCSPLMVYLLKIFIFHRNVTLCP